MYLTGSGTVVPEHFMKIRKRGGIRIPPRDPPLQATIGRRLEAARLGDGRNESGLLATRSIS